MRNYRSLCQFLRREYSQFQLSFRRVALGEDYGKCNLVGGTYYIAIDRDLCEGGAILCLLHEMAHVLSWHKDKAASQHGPAFGEAYHIVWESYLRYLGRSARKRGTGMAAKKPTRSAGMEISTTLRSRMLQKAAAFNPKKKTLWEKLNESDPAKGNEIRQLILDWHRGDEELRKAYPLARALARALVVEELPVPIGMNTWLTIIDQLKA